MAEYIEREYVLKCMDDSYKSAGISAEVKRKVTRWLSKAPAADVRPVVWGKWVESKSIMEVLYCSECGFRTIYGAMPDGLGRNYSYCPNCGADMREES